jgi:hypothetical protein
MNGILIRRVIRGKIMNLKKIISFKNILEILSLDLKELLILNFSNVLNKNLLIL